MNQSHDLPNKPHNLPSQPTPFIGRQDEISEIIDLLGGARCRLLTLTGAGGVGKTLLAMQAAAEMAGAFPDGVYFVPLQSVNTTEFLVPALADALKFPLSGQEAPRVQLLNHLHGQALLLVLDNFEQLLDGVDLLVDMLQTSPGIKLKNQNDQK